MAEPLIKLRRRGLELAVLAVALLACLLPFAGKAFHIDDTLFVWAGQHIQKHPFDFYGFDVNWYTTWEPMAGVTQNPPATCYYLALAGSLFGWGEVGLHVAMLLPAWGLVWGAYRLAERFGVRPLPAALLTLLTPVTLVSGSSVMCDLTMTCLWVWTVIIWDRGLRERSTKLLLIAGGLIALTTVTKYFGICLIPLLGVYSCAVDKANWRRWALALGFAVALLAVYQWVFLMLYGQGGLAGAMGYAATIGTHSAGARLYRSFEALGFVGGCFGVAAVPAIFLVRRSALLVIVLLVVAATVASRTLTGVTVFESGYSMTDSPFAPNSAQVPDVAVFCQFLLWVAAGAAVLLLTVDDLLKHRDPVALLLFLWVAGTAVFAAYVNWTLNARSVLPLIPAAALTLVRRLERESLAAWVLPALVAASAVLALVVTYADACMANANRTAARQLVADWTPPTNRPLWFEGHWGFQYYAQAAGARSWDFEVAAGKTGDILVIPFNNCITASPDSFARQIEVLDVPGNPWLATMYAGVGAGYYACGWDWRPLPFAFTEVPPERYLVFRLTADQRAERK
jgi:hypothetical protein